MALSQTTLHLLTHNMRLRCCRTGVKAPLAIGDVLLADGAAVKGFVGEAYAVAGCPDISEHGGWRAYISKRPA
jgi:allophanate hydrolase